MGQTRTWSAVEAVANVAVGIGVAFVAQLVVFNLMGIPVTLSQNAGISLFMTVVSLARSYVLRRVFNYISDK